MTCSHTATAPALHTGDVRCTAALRCGKLRGTAHGAVTGRGLPWACTPACCMQHRGWVHAPAWPGQAAMQSVRPASAPRTDRKLLEQVAGGAIGQCDLPVVAGNGQHVLLVPHARHNLLAVLCGRDWAASEHMHTHQAWPRPGRGTPGKAQQPVKRAPLPSLALAAPHSPFPLPLPQSACRLAASASLRMQVWSIAGSLPPSPAAAARRGAVT